MLCEVCISLDKCGEKELNTCPDYSFDWNQCILDEDEIEESVLQQYLMDVQEGRIQNW